MRIKNKKVYSHDQQTLVDLRVDYELLGFATRIDPGVLTIYTRRKKKKREKDESVRRSR